MDTDIFARIRDDHDKHRTLIELVEKTKGDSRGRRELFGKLADDVRAHADAEERIFYAELLALTEGREMAGHSVKEHREVDTLIEELLAMDYSSTGWLNRFATLAHDLRHHMDEEEKEVFPLAGRLLSEERKKAMVAEFEEAKQLEMDERAA